MWRGGGEVGGGLKREGTGAGWTFICPFKTVCEKTYLRHEYILIKEIIVEHNKGARIIPRFYKSAFQREWQTIKQVPELSVGRNNNFFGL